MDTARHHFVTFSLLIISATLVSGLQAAAGTEVYGRLPLRFESNQGQAGPATRFIARGAGFQALLEETPGAVLAFADARGAIRMRLRGGRKNARATALDALPGEVNYFTGRDPRNWRTHIPHYGRVAYRDVYPGIDLVFHGSQSRLEYDFVVRPGAGPDRIVLAFEGAERLSVDEHGDLLLTAGGRTIRQHRPVLYQVAGGSLQPVSGGYLLGPKNQVRFRVAEYDRGRDLVIDPVLAAAAYIGGGLADTALAVAVDAAGAIYVAGRTFSSDIAASSGAFRASSSGNHDAFVAKLTAGADAFVYFTYLGGSDDDEAAGIVVDASGTAYVAGRTFSADFPATPAAAQQNAGGGADAFVARIAAAGDSLIYSTYVGGSGNESARGIALDAGANAYITGATGSPDFPATPGAFQAAPAGEQDAFVAELNDGGTALVYATCLGGTADDGGTAIAVDSGGNAYVAGWTASADFPATANAWQKRYSGGDSDAFVARLRVGGELAFATYLGGKLDDRASAIAVDAAGNAWFTGWTGSRDFPVVGALQPAFGGGGSDAFIAEVDASGTKLVYSTYYGGSGADGGNAIALDPAGNIYVVGETESADFPATPGAGQAVLGGGDRDAFVLGLTAAGSPAAFATLLGGGAQDRAFALAVDASGAVYVAGETGSSNFPVPAGAAASLAGGPVDGFLAVFRPLAAAASPAISTFGIVNAATLVAGPVAPGSLVSIFGSNLGGAQASSETPVTALGGTSVFINDVPAPLFVIGPNRIVAQIPVDIPVGTATAVVTVAGTSSAPFAFAVAATAPGIFQSAAGAVSNEDHTMNSAGNPALTGSTITVYLTGQGPLDIPVATGTAGSSERKAVAATSASAVIGNSPAAISFLGLAPGFVGLAQANIVVPDLASGSYPLSITIGDAVSNAVMVAVKKQ